MSRLLLTVVFKLTWVTEYELFSPERSQYMQHNAKLSDRSCQYSQPQSLHRTVEHAHKWSVQVELRDVESPAAHVYIAMFKLDIPFDHTISDTPTDKLVQLIPDKFL